MVIIMVTRGRLTIGNVVTSVKRLENVKKYVN